MGQVLFLESNLRDKIKTTKIKNPKAFLPEEFNLLLEIVDNEEADREDRLVAAKTLYECAENSWRAQQQIAENYKVKYLNLQHAQQQERNAANLASEIASAKLEPGELMRVLNKLIGKKD